MPKAPTPPAVRDGRSARLVRTDTKDFTWKYSTPEEDAAWRAALLTGQTGSLVDLPLHHPVFHTGKTGIGPHLRTAVTRPPRPLEEPTTE